LPQGIEWVSQIRSLVNGRKEGLISESEITTAVERLFAERFKRRMFDPRIHHKPFFRCSIGGAPSEMTRESMVLLQNDRTLPLTGNTQFSVFDANADNIDMMWSNYDGFNIKGTKTILEGLRSKPGLIVYFTEGCDNVNPTTIWIDLWKRSRLSLTVKL
jgi:beta-glucosidase-like glycosyl hydrolase